MLLEIVDGALVDVCLGPADALQAADVLPEAAQDLARAGGLLLDVARVERHVGLERGQAVHDRAVDGLAAGRDVGRDRGEGQGGVGRRRGERGWEGRCGGRGGGRGRGRERGCGGGFVERVRRRGCIVRRGGF